MTLKFEEYSEMLECFELLESMIAYYLRPQYRKARCLHDIQFWKINLPKYSSLLLS